MVYRKATVSLASGCWKQAQASEKCKGKEWARAEKHQASLLKTYLYCGSSTKKTKAEVVVFFWGGGRK